MRRAVPQKPGSARTANPRLIRGTRLAPSGDMATTLTLPPFPVFFATSEGQTRRIAERFAIILRDEGLESATYDVANLQRTTVEWTAVRSAIVGASLHAGKHQPAAAAFVTAHVRELNGRPSLFFSVSLAAASQHRDEVE